MAIVQRSLSHLSKEFTNQNTNESEKTKIAEEQVKHENVIIFFI